MLQEQRYINNEIINEIQDGELFTTILSSNPQQYIYTNGNTNELKGAELFTAISSTNPLHYINNNENINELKIWYIIYTNICTNPTAPNPTLPASMIAPKSPTYSLISPTH